MTQNKHRIQRLTLAAFFVAIEVIMGFTPIGYIPIGALSITTMHLPVILGSILFGPGFGAGIGFVFGLTSFLRATFQPGITSFVFTPFVSVGNTSGNVWSLVICFVPRIVLGVLPSYCYQFFLKKTKKASGSAAISAVICTIIHTLMVLGGIYLFFGKPYAEALGTTIKGLVAVLAGVMSTNMVFEAILAGIVVPVLVKALTPATRKMGVLYEK